MKILFIYPNANGYQRVPLGASILITILKNKGHEIELFDTTFMRGQNKDNELRIKSGFVIPTKEISSEVLLDDEIEIKLIRRINNFNPDIICATIVEDNYRYCNSLLKTIKRVHPEIPIIVGGSTPTIASEILINNPNIDCIVKGESENRLLSLIKAIESGRRCYIEDKENPYTDLDTLPVQDLSLWDERHFIKPYDGKIYKAGFIEASRGCMNNCSYCINASWKELYNVKKSMHFRRKSIDKVIEEAKELKEKYNFNMFFFTDDDFLNMGRKRIYEFAKRWYVEIDLPYWINTRTEMITEFKLRNLKNSGCAGIGFGIESGSEWLRENILNKKGHTNKEIIKTFDLIKNYGIRTTANFMIGFPAETEDDILDTIKLARRIKADSIDVTFVSPYYGTELHNLCSRLKYIEIDNEIGFEGMAKRVSMRAEPTISLPQISKERLIEIYNNFQKYIDSKSNYALDRFLELKKVLETLNIIRHTKNNLA